jgi:hypothetical protein
VLVDADCLKDSALLCALPAGWPRFCHGRIGLANVAAMPSSRLLVLTDVSRGRCQGGAVGQEQRQWCKRQLLRLLLDWLRGGGSSLWRSARYE